MSITVRCHKCGYDTDCYRVKRGMLCLTGAYVCAPCYQANELFVQEHDRMVRNYP